MRGNTWRVISVPAVPDDPERLLNGLCDYSTRRIYIVRGLTPDETRTVFFHEWFHALCFEYKFYVSSLTPDVEELLSEVFADEIKKFLKKI